MGKAPVSRASRSAKTAKQRPSALSNRKQELVLKGAPTRTPPNPVCPVPTTECGVCGAAVPKGPLLRLPYACFAVPSTCANPKCRSAMCADCARTCFECTRLWFNSASVRTASPVKTACKACLPERRACPIHSWAVCKKHAAHDGFPCCRLPEVRARLRGASPRQSQCVIL